MPTSAAPSRVPPNHAATSPSFVSTIVDACALANGAVSNTNSACGGPATSASESHAARCRMRVCCDSFPPEASMRNASAALAILVALAGAPGSDLAYQEVKDWPKLPPSVQLGECAGVAVDATGHVFIFHRPGRGFDTAATEKLAEPTVLEVDPDSGRLINAWGANAFLVPHGITIDGSNNVFLTDVGLQQVF